MEWIATTEKLHPDKPGTLRYEQIPCLIVKNCEILLRQWNCEHLVWDDEGGDDFYCKAEDVTHWMPLPAPPTRKLCGTPRRTDMNTNTDGVSAMSAELSPDERAKRDALLDHIHEYGTAAEGVLRLAADLCQSSRTAEREACKAVCRAVAERYPTGVWPEKGESLDCTSASMARITAANIEREINERSKHRQ